MKALLDTNIIIHRESNRIINRDIGNLFRWLDKGQYTKVIHPVTVQEITKNSNKSTVNVLEVKMASYEQIRVPAPFANNMQKVSALYDKNENDINDSKLLNEVLCERVDLLITEDKKIHFKADILGIADKVFSIDSFLEKVISEHPELINYKILSVKKKYFGDINIDDEFFDSFKEDYDGFSKWFNRKANEEAYVTLIGNKILSFLFLKIEDATENYTDIHPSFAPKKRLKIGTFKVVSNGVRLGERFLKIIFDNALLNRVDEIYVTIFDKRSEQQRLISLLETWGFCRYGIKTTKNGNELVYVRNFSPHYFPDNPKLSFPYVSSQRDVFIVPIRPDYHTNLLPDSILRTEDPIAFIDSEPHRNAIKKVYISRSIERDLHSGDIIIFYRTGGYHKSVITTIGIVEDVCIKFKDEAEFIRKCRKRSVFTDDELKVWWNEKPWNRPFIVNFLYAYSFPHRINLKELIDLKIIPNIESAPRGFTRISKDDFDLIIKRTQTDASFIVD